MYRMTQTRQDIAFVVSRISQFMSNPTDQHWESLKKNLEIVGVRLDLPKFLRIILAPLLLKVNPNTTNGRNISRYATQGIWFKKM